jgi:hypothetical protein
MRSRVLVQKSATHHGWRTAKSHGLPPGWRCAYEPSGRAYFINDITRTTTFHDPRPESQRDHRFDVVRVSLRNCSHEERGHSQKPLMAGFPARRWYESGAFLVGARGNGASVACSRCPESQPLLFAQRKPKACYPWAGAWCLSQMARYFTAMTCHKPPRFMTPGRHGHHDLTRFPRPAQHTIVPVRLRAQVLGAQHGKTSYRGLNVHTQPHHRQELRPTFAP